MKVAIVGGGVSGLSTLWALSHSPHKDTTHLFEAGPWVGGHTNTRDFCSPAAESEGEGEGEGEGGTVPVDTGFIVFNKVTYPNFLRFLQAERVDILDSDMSFSVSRDHGAFEWAGTSPAALFCQPENLVNPAHWRMVWDILRFNQQAVEFLRNNNAAASACAPTARERETAIGIGISIGQWLNERGYSHAFVANYLVPMTASIWSTAPSTTLSDFPALTLLRFMHNHHLLQILHRPQWLTIARGSRNYIAKILARFHPHADPLIRTRIVSAHRDPHTRTWSLTDHTGTTYHGYDRVVFACHADTAAEILKGNVDVDHEVHATLAAFKFSKNVAMLHSDQRLLPTRKQAWAAWNFLTEKVAGRDVDAVCLTYNMNILQSIPAAKHGNVLVTLNPTGSYMPDPALVQYTQEYEHPLYTPESVDAQTRLGGLQGRQGLLFAGAWTNYGFHEDGFSSGLRAALAIGDVSLPFDVRPAERALPTRKTVALVTVEALDALARSAPVRIAAGLYATLLIHVLLVLESVLGLGSLATARGFLQDARKPVAASTYAKAKTA